MSGLPGDPVVTSGGSYSTTVDHGWSGTVTPTKAGYTFDPANRVYSFVTSDQANQDYTPTLKPDIITGSVTTFFTTPGADTFYVPEGVTSITVKAWGGGGGGGAAAVYSSHAGTAGGDGGGAGFAEVTLSVTAGEALDIHVGGAGSGGATGSECGAGGGGGGGSEVSRSGTPLIVAPGGAVPAAVIIILLMFLMVALAVQEAVLKDKLALELVVFSFVVNG